MNNQEIINSWNEWCNKLSSFKISDVKAGVNVGDQQFLIRYFKPRSILEIGTRRTSTINIASAIDYNNEELKEKQLTVDIRDVNSLKNLVKLWMTKSPLEMTKELNLSELVNYNS